jgi:hypothetical protein
MKKPLFHTLLSELAFLGEALPAGDRKKRVLALPKSINKATHAIWHAIDIIRLEAGILRDSNTVLHNRERWLKSDEAETAKADFIAWSKCVKHLEAIIGPVFQVIADGSDDPVQQSPK